MPAAIDEQLNLSSDNLAGQLGLTTAYTLGTAGLSAVMAPLSLGGEITTFAENPTKENIPVLGSVATNVAATTAECLYNECNWETGSQMVGAWSGVVLTVTTPVQVLRASGKTAHQKKMTAEEISGEDIALVEIKRDSFEFKKYFEPGETMPNGQLAGAGPGAALRNEILLKSLKEFGIDKTFLDNTAERIILDAPMTVKRYHGGVSGKIGRYMTSDTFKSRREARKRLALKNEWGNRISKETTVELPAGTVIWKGKVAPQIQKNGKNLSGGGDQIWVESDLNESWFTKTKHFR